MTIDYTQLANMLAADLDPQALQRILQLGSQSGRSQLVQQQLDQGRQLQGSQMAQGHKTPLGALFAGIGDIANAGRGAHMQQQATKQLGALNQEQSQALAAMGPAMQQNATRLRTRDDQMHGLKVRGIEQDLERGALGLDESKRNASEAQQPISAPMREMLKSYGVNVPEGATNGQMRQYMGGIFDLVKEKMEQTGQNTRLDKTLGAQRDAAAAELEAKRREAGIKGTGDLRKELQGRPEFKAFNEVSVAYEKVKAASGSTDPAANMALIFSYMKMLDPGSSVREGEYANAQNTTGIPGQVLNMYNKARSGNFLNPQQIADFVNAAGRAYAPHKAQFDALASQYTGLAQKQGADPADVVLGGGGGQPAGAGGMSGPPRISGDAEFDALPSGAMFTDPQGNVRKKP